MGGNYQKDLYKQLMEVMARVDGLEFEQKQDKKEIKRLTGEVTSLCKENAALREEVSSLKQENAILTERCGKLEKENTLLRNDNERMKRILNNDSSNSSRPPSKDEGTKPVNTYNSRKETSRKQGAQKGHNEKKNTGSTIYEKKQIINGYSPVLPSAIRLRSKECPGGTLAGDCAWHGRLKRRHRPDGIL